MHRLTARLVRQTAAAAAGRQRAGTPAAVLAPRSLQHTRRFHATAGRRRPLAPQLIQAIASPFRLPFAEPAPQPVPVFVAPAPAVPLTQRIGLLWQAYLRSLEQRPLLTKAATSFVCVFIGDSLAQLIGGVPYSLVCVLRLAAYSSTVGAATGHYWHRWLEANVHPAQPTSSKAVTAKTLLDQLVLSPAMLLLYLTALKMMEGRPDMIVPYVQDKYLTTLVTGWALWTPYNLASFKFIPQDLRILAGNLAGIAWGTWMSVTCINAAAPSAISGACPATAAAVAAAVAGGAAGAM
ncbi:peroxisomal membrane MPV17 PMP22 isoform 2 [Micractinium conductrix]|uniref:Peroxisomal membrane MPV17 PMP22 isoform 2 n=1 Tax=Micractinium conductrix TaxID=554055 RepID=A0A2P6V632_9CHLO|nr:peroxisomal membrane MPV17 PMP22 isoform 2 [Micractinium conductrix]|eukprot:PSC69542.1 peroxisomal membrane MPV17 PMP22 isoform 2 [Micractinium conductrix]